jgi:hypothetical protein
MSRRFMSINLAKPIETVEQFPFVLCAWPSFADQPYINNYRIYDDRVGETTRFTYRPNHEWYWFPQQKPTEVSMLKCYDSVTDGSVSRWSFHTARTDPTAPVASGRFSKRRQGEWSWYAGDFVVTGSLGKDAHHDHQEN